MGNDEGFVLIVISLEHLHRREGYLPRGMHRPSYTQRRFCHRGWEVLGKFILRQRGDSEDSYQTQAVFKSSLQSGKRLSECSAASLNVCTGNQSCSLSLSSRARYISYDPFQISLAFLSCQNSSADAKRHHSCLKVKCLYFFSASILSPFPV